MILTLHYEMKLVWLWVANHYQQSTQASGAKDAVLR